MQLTPYEKSAQREIDTWLRGDASPIMQAFDYVTRPLDWLVERAVPEEVVEHASDAVGRFLNTLNDASEWTYDYKDLLKQAQAQGVEAGHVEALREASVWLQGLGHFEAVHLDAFERFLRAEGLDHERDDGEDDDDEADEVDDLVHGVPQDVVRAGGAAVRVR